MGMSGNWLFDELPEHLRRMCLFKLNTGRHEAEFCGLKWEWEQPYPALNTSLFVIPDEFVKNRSDRVVVLNRVASEVIEQARGGHSEYVFTYRGQQVKSMYKPIGKLLVKKPD